MRKLRGDNAIDPTGVGSHFVPRVVRVLFWVLSAILISYGLYGTISGTLVLPAGKGRSGESFAAMQLHGWSAFVAFAALICFCLAMRAAIIDEYLRFRGTGQHRRLSTFVLLILSFALLMAAMV